MIHATKYEFSDVYSLGDLRAVTDITKHWPEHSLVEINEYGTQLVVSYVEEL